MLTWTTAPAAILLLPLFLLFAPLGAASQLGIDFGSAAATQLFAQALRHTLKSPLPFEFRLNPYGTHEGNGDDLARFDVDNKIAYSNVSIEFHQRVMRLSFDNFKMHTDTVVVADLWPVLFDRQLIQTRLESKRVSLELAINSTHVDVSDCVMEESDFTLASDHSSIFEMSMVIATPFIKPYIGSMVCPVLKKAVVNAHYNSIQELPYDSILPQNLNEVIVNTNSSLFYQLDLIQLREKHMCMDVQMSWDELTLGDSVASTLDDFSYCSIKDSEDDRVTVWMDDALANSLFEQIKWNFQWMEERIPVTSPQLPQSSRDFLSALCLDCYFLLRVWANGRPVLTAVNSSIVAEINERINLKVVNPDRNVTSVFVSFSIKIAAQLKPTFDGTTLRTGLELVDTEIKMEKGAFPDGWTFFVQDLVKGMIMDVIWPELKRTVEDLTYAQGLPISKWCGVDPNGIQALIDDSKFGLSARLTLKNLLPEQCAQDMKANLPKMDKLLAIVSEQKLRRKREL